MNSLFGCKMGLYVSEKSPRLMAEICTLNMCVFVFWKPEIPYLLMESLIFGGEGLCYYVLWGWESRLF